MHGIDVIGLAEDFDNYEKYNTNYNEMENSLDRGEKTNIATHKHRHILRTLTICLFSST